MKLFRTCATSLLMLGLLANGAWAQDTLEGLPKVAEWTDLETTAGELPDMIWGNCDTIGADAAGIIVEFDDGSTGSAVYYNLADKWNTDYDTNSGFPGLVVGPLTGILSECTDLHFLYNNNSTLPMAWNACSVPAASNFDLDYGEQNGSNFRASTTGWVSATFQTYCGEPTLQSVPLMTDRGITIAVLLLAMIGFVAIRRRRVST